MNDLSLIQKERVRGALLHMEQLRRDKEYAIIGDSDSLPIKSLFSNGLYVREIFIPKGMFVMGKIHRHEHPNILVRGKVIMITESGLETLEGPKTMLSPAGTKRFLFTLEDTIWITVHKTTKDNAFEAEDEIVTTRYEDLEMEYEAVMHRIQGGS